MITPVPEPVLATLDLDPKTIEGLDELSLLFNGTGFDQLDRRGLPRGMDPAEADLLLVPAINELNHTLSESNAGDGFGQPPVASGDRLFDRYAEAMDLVINAHNGDDIIRGVPPVIPDTTLAGWEGEFGGDPRYWELRYISKLLGGLRWDEGTCSPKEEMIRAELDNRTTAVGFLHEARRRGIAAPDTLLLLYAEELYTGWLREKICSAPEPVLDADELAALLDDVIVVDPDNAWAWYLKSFSLFEDGQVIQALDAMERGNALPEFVHPKPFPLPELLAGIADDAPRGSAVVSGAGLVLSRDFPITYIQMIRRDLSLTFSHIDRTNDLSPLDTWHTFSCRYARCWPEDPLMPMIGLSFISQIGEYMGEHTNGESDPRRDVLKTMFRARNQARHGLEDSNDDTELRQDLAVLSLVGGARGSCLAQYLQAERQFRQLEDDVLPVVDAIASLDYPGLLDADQLLAFIPD